MGIGILWSELGHGELVKIAELSAEHFEKHKRPFHIVVDEPSWRYANLTAAEVASVRRQEPRANPVEKNNLYNLSRLEQWGMKLTFVFDGDKRPAKPGRPRPPHSPYQYTALWKETLTSLGVNWIVAEGEAEAECARMQQLGLADAVWSIDGDVFTFGCDTLIRFHHIDVKKKDGSINQKKSETEVRLYRLSTICKVFPGLDRDGFVLYSILCGGDYDTRGLANFGIKSFRRVVATGIGKSLCACTTKEQLANWRNELEECLARLGLNPSIPQTFPDFKIFMQYNAPLVHDDRSLQIHMSKRMSPLHEQELSEHLAMRYNFHARSYANWIIPMFLMRSLVQTQPGQEGSNKCYKIQANRVKGSSYLSKVTFLLSAATTKNMVGWRLTATDQTCYEADATVEFRALSSIIQLTVPDALVNVAPPKPTRPLVTKNKNAANEPTRKVKTAKSASTRSNEVNNRAEVSVTTVVSPLKKRGMPAKDSNSKVNEVDNNASHTPTTKDTNTVSELKKRGRPMRTEHSDSKDGKAAIKRIKLHLSPGKSSTADRQSQSAPCIVISDDEDADADFRKVFKIPSLDD